MSFDSELFYMIIIIWIV